MKLTITHKGKKIEINDILECRGIKKYIGLMFKGKNTNALLFKFSKAGREPIHSFFCSDFLAIWILDGKIVEYKFVESWKTIVRPEKEFNILLEVPINEKYLDVVSNFS